MIPKDKSSLAVVLNTTSNSNFCNRYESYNDFSNAIDEIEKLAVTQNQKIIIDVGAESTSPLNDKISAEEEISRLNLTLGKKLKEKPFSKNLILSLDTYRPETMKVFLNYMNENSYDELIFNDVSGCYKESTIKEMLLENHKLKYVVGHNPANDRSKTGAHLDFVNVNNSPVDAMKELLNYFKDSFHYFQNLGLEKQVIFDPCFSFGKTKEQTRYLAFHLEDLVTEFPVDLWWMIGASRKSFLRSHLDVNSSDDKDAILKEMELVHFFLLTDWQKKLKERNIIYRVHDPYLFLLSKKTSLL